MNVFIVRMDERGRIVIPENIRRSLGVLPGDLLAVQDNKNHAVLTKHGRSATRLKNISRNVFEEDDENGH